MNQPELYRRYSMEEALALLGSDEGCQPLCGGHWVILPRAILCFAEVGDTRVQSHFSTGSRVPWVADQAYEVSEGQFGFLPSVVTGQSQDTRPIHLFIRPPEAHEFTFAGWLSNSHVRGIGGEHPFGIADFTLSPTLPSALWCSIGGLSVPGNEDVDIDQVIESLASPQSSQSRFSILEQLINYWHGPCQREDAYSDEELAGHCIPLPLRRWYRHGGKRRGILDGQNILIDPEKLKVGDDGRLLFYVENQGVYLWSTIAKEDDPSVWGRFNEAGDTWIKEDVTLSEFLIQACLFEATNSAPYGASAAWADQETLDRVVGPLKPVPLGAWRWPSYPSRFHAGNGAFVFSCLNGEWQGTLGYSIWIGAKSETPLTYLRGIVDDSWEYQAI